MVSVKKILECVLKLEWKFLLRMVLKFLVKFDWVQLVSLKKVLECFLKLELYYLE